MLHSWSLVFTNLLNLLPGVWANRQERTCAAPGEHAFCCLSLTIWFSRHAIVKATFLFQPAKTIGSYSFWYQDLMIIHSNFKILREIILISGSDRQTDQRNSLVIKRWNRNPVMWKLCHWPFECFCGLVSSTSTSTLLSVLVVLRLLATWVLQWSQKNLWSRDLVTSSHETEGGCQACYACTRTMYYAICMH